jgi:hypothetical protein
MHDTEPQPGWGDDDDGAIRVRVTGDPYTAERARQIIHHALLAAGMEPEPTPRHLHAVPNPYRARLPRRAQTP